MLLLIVGPPLSGQQNQTLDSLLLLFSELEQEDTAKVNLGLEIASIELYSNPNKARKTLQEMLEIAEKLKYSKGLGKGYYFMSGYYMNRYELDSSEFFIRKALKINRAHNRIIESMKANSVLAHIFNSRRQYDSANYYLQQNIRLETAADDKMANNQEFAKALGKTYANISNIHTWKGRQQLALINRLKSLEYFKKTGDQSFIADGYNNLAITEYELGDYNSAVQNHLKALKTYEKTGDVFFQTSALMGLAEAEVGLKNYDSAIEYGEKVLTISNDHNYQNYKSLALILLGNVYKSKGEYERSESHYIDAVSTIKNMEDQSNLIWAYLGLGELYNAINEPRKALEYLELAAEIGDSTKQSLVQALVYKASYSANKQLGRYDVALEYHEKASKINDSVFTADKSRQIEELRTIYETEKKEQQIIQQETEIALLEQEAKVNNLQRMVLGGGLGLSLMVFGIGFYGIRQKMKRNKLEKEKVDAELAYKKKELTTHALHLAKKNEILESLKQKAQHLKKKENAPGYQELIKTINFDQQDDRNWESFTQYFEQVHKNFAVNVKKRYPTVTKNELRFMALMKMNMSSKEIATILNISPDGIKKARQRLRKKMDLEPQDSLENTVLLI